MNKKIFRWTTETFLDWWYYLICFRHHHIRCIILYFFFFTSRTNRRHLHEIVHSILLRLFFSVRPQTTLIHIIKWQLLFSLSMMSVASREYEFFFKGEKKRNHQKNSNNFNILSGCTEWRNFFVCLSREFTYKSNELLVNEKGKISM